MFLLPAISLSSFDVRMICLTIFFYLVAKYNSAYKTKSLMRHDLLVLSMNHIFAMVVMI